MLEPALAFIEDFAPRLEEISPHFRADPRPRGGSLFRIYRDTRFSKDKTPYKTNVGIQFRHERAKDAPRARLLPAPRRRARCSPAAASGSRTPPARTAIREAIVADPTAGRRATRTGAFTKRLELGGDSLKRAAAGFDAEHPYTEDLKRKDFFVWAKLGEDDVVAPGFLDEYARVCLAAAPLMRTSAARSTWSTETPKRGGVRGPEGAPVIACYAVRRSEPSRSALRRDPQSGRFRPSRERSLRASPRTDAPPLPRLPSSPRARRPGAAIVLIDERDEACEAFDLLDAGMILLPDNPKYLFALGRVDALDLDKPSVHRSSFRRYPTILRPRARDVWFRADAIR